MTWCAALTALLLAACGATATPVSAPAPKASAPTATPASATPPKPSVPPARAACVPLPADAGSPQGAFVLASGYSEVRLYRLGPAGCATLVATIDPGGPRAFASIGEVQLDGMPELSIETWLMHGDRRRQRFRWSGDHYTESGLAEEIPGPRR